LTGFQHLNQIWRANFDTSDYAGNFGRDITRLVKAYLPEDIVADARTGTRFPVHLPIKVLGLPGAKASQEGTTENISGAGVYIWVDQTLEVNSRVEFEITIPKAAIAAEQDVVLHCIGRVVRADSQPSEKSGVACVIDEYDFVRREGR